MNKNFKDKLTKTTGKKNIIYKGKPISMDLYEVEIKHLYFNPYNTRIFDQVAVFTAETEVEKLLKPEVQDFIFESLKKTHSDPINKKLKKEIKIQINDPFVVNEKGILLAGNNRLGILKSMQEKNEIPSDYKVKVALRADVNTKSEIRSWEMSLQHEGGSKKEYDRMNILLQIKSLMDDGETSEEILEKTPLKSIKEVEESVAIATIYEELLIFAGVPNKLDLHREISPYSALAGLVSTLKKQGVTVPEKNYVKRIYFKSILATNIQVVELRTNIIDKFIGKSNIKTATDNKVALLENIDKIITKKVDKTLKHNRENSYTDIKTVDLKSEVSKMRKLVEEKIDIWNAANDKDFKYILKSYKEISKKADAVLEKYDGKSLKHLGKDEKKSLETEVKNIKNKISEIENLTK